MTARTWINNHRRTSAALVVVLVAAIAGSVYFLRQRAAAARLNPPLESIQQVEAIAGGVSDNLKPIVTDFGTRINEAFTAINGLKADVKAIKEQPILTPEQVRTIVDEKMKGVKEAVPPSVPMSQYKALEDRVGEFERNFPPCSVA